MGPAGMLATSEIRRGRGTFVHGAALGIACFLGGLFIFETSTLLNRVVQL